MKNKVELIIKLVITAAIITVLVLLALPVLEGRGIIPRQEAGVQTSPEQQSGRMPQNSFADRRGGNIQAGAVSAQAINTGKASIGTVSEYIKVNGDVAADAEIDIYPDVAGKVVSSSLSVGDRVKSGQSIAFVDPSMPGQNFAESAVYSTISGTVLAVNVREGDKVSTGTPVAKIGDLSKLKIRTYIPEKYTGNLRTGLPAEVSFSAWPETLFSAEISTISPVLDPVSRTAEVELYIRGAAEEIKPGMFASVKLVTHQVKGVITVPAEAVFSYYGNDTVYVVKDNKTVERRAVQTGMTTVELVEILSGLADGEIVVTEGQSLLKDGSTVKIADQE